MVQTLARLADRAIDYCRVFAAWFGWDYWQAIQDERALKEYLVELDQREPNWRERVYGTEATAEQADSERRWNELIKSVKASARAWAPYNEALFHGMYNDPTRPTACLPEEQAAFLTRARDVGKHLRLETIDTVIPMNRKVLKDVSHEKFLEILNADLVAIYMVDERTQIELMYQLQQNHPTEAVTWLRRCLRLQGIRYELPRLHSVNPNPFFVERLLNLTEPDRIALRGLQHDVEDAVHWLETKPYLQFGTDCRLCEKTINNISNGEFDIAELERYYFQYLIPKESLWNSSWLQSARGYYLRALINGLYRRPNNVALKMHQLADQIESLATLPKERRWMTWNSFCESNGIPANNIYPQKPPHTDSIPDGVFYLAPNPQTHILFLFQREAQMKTALAAIGAERFRLNHGRFPLQWSELVPSYLAKEIIDPFAGKPLVIKETDKGIVIYSTGRDGKDEGGENLNSNHYWHYGGKVWDWKKTNIGTRVYLPQFRREAPIQLDESQKEALNKWKSFEAEQKKKAGQGNK